jgi:hypothetical protein
VQQPILAARVIISSVVAEILAGISGLNRITPRSM